MVCNAFEVGSRFLGSIQTGWQNPSTVRNSSTILRTHTNNRPAMSRGALLDDALSHSFALPTPLSSLLHLNRIQIPKPQR